MLNLKTSSQNLGNLVRNSSALNGTHKIPLEATIASFYEQPIPMASRSEPGLTLKLNFLNANSNYHYSFSFLHLNLNLPLVRELYEALKYEALKMGESAKINGNIEIEDVENRWWRSYKSSREFYGHLEGTLVVGDNQYYTIFVLDDAGPIYPHLEVIIPENVYKTFLAKPRVKSS